MKFHKISYGIKDSNDRITTLRQDYEVMQGNLKTAFIIAYNSMVPDMKEGDKFFFDVPFQSDDSK